ncbi:transmembrane protein C1orf162 homolog isoform X2 [Ambystoma mexicanum]|uniref:transmembrane protein C1orf162 homolog isoform X2 n=1 Tax=Ambystoma mexicanum TaxID=8296 RepID=UPI0037E6FAA3
MVLHHTSELICAHEVSTKQPNHIISPKNTVLQKKRGTGLGTLEEGAFAQSAVASAGDESVYREPLTEDTMGGGSSTETTQAPVTTTTKPTTVTTTTEATTTTIATTTTTMAASQAHCNEIQYFHLILSFFSGVLLTMLIFALIFCIWKKKKSGFQEPRRRSDVCKFEFSAAHPLSKKWIESKKAT